MSEIKCVSIINKVRDGKRISYITERIYDKNDNLVIINYLNIGGQLHRDKDKPAYIKVGYDNNGVSFISEKRWYQNGKLHRPSEEEDLPASVLYNINTTKIQENWYYEGKRHRDGDKPALIIRHQNNNIGRLEWYQNGTLHRDGDLPASISQNENGIVIRQQWYRKNIPYNPPSLGVKDEILDKDNCRPSIISYHPEDGCTKYWWYKNYLYTIGLIKYDNELNQKEYEEQNKYSNYIDKLSSASDEYKRKVFKIMDILDE